MGKIKKILENELIGGTQSTDVYPVTSTKAVYDENNKRLDNIIKEIQDAVEAEVSRLDETDNEIKEKLNDKTNEINIAKEEALQAITENEQSAITNFNSQRVTPEMLSESTKQLIEASGGGTITNLADDEDITSVDDGTGSNVLKLADKTYNADNFSGKGYKILRKNMVDGKNILTQNMINDSNVTYEIKYDFDLNGQKIIIPKNSTLKFVGGSFSNGTIACADVSICVDNKYPIFIDVVIAYIANASINGIGYEWMTKDTKRTDDYLSLLNMLQFREAIIEEKTVLNIESWVNPYTEQHGSNHIRTSTICLDGRGCVINILCDDYSKERPISKTQTDYTWGIDLDPYSFIHCHQFDDRRGEQKLIIKNLRIIDDKAINGRGADLTNPYVSYNDQVDRDNRGVFIGVSFVSNKVQGLEMIFDNIYFRSRQGFIGANLSVKDKVNIPNVLFNNCELYTLCNFTNELWGKYGSINTLYFMNCILNTYNSTITSSGTPKYIIYKNCTFISDCLCQVGVTENCQAKVIYENCRFVNAGPVFNPSSYADIEVYNSLFYTKNINGHYGNFKGIYWDFSVNGNILYDNCKFNLYSVTKRFIGGTETNCIIKNSEIIINDDNISANTGKPLHSLIIVNTKFFNYVKSVAFKRFDILPQATNNRILDVSFNYSIPYNKHNNDIKSFIRSANYPVDVTRFAYDSEIIYPYNSKQDDDIFKGNILYKCSQRDFNFIHKSDIVFNTDFSIDVMVESYVLEAVQYSPLLITFNIGTISFQIEIINERCQFKINTRIIQLPLQRGLHNYSITFHKYKHDGYLEDKGNLNYNTVIPMIDGEIVNDLNAIGSFPDIQFENNRVSACTIQAGGNYGLKGLILKNFATIL